MEIINEQHGIQAKIILDSLAPSGCRLTTLELTYPRFIHSQLMTHRVFSRNSASSRAIPTKTLIAKAQTTPAMPIFWGKIKKGMSPTKEIDDIEEAKAIWLAARDQACEQAKKLYELQVHKQIVNRILEPFLMHTIILSSTNFSNWNALRNHGDAQQEIALLAQVIERARERSTPGIREWHLPYLQPGELEEFGLETMKKVCTARCARVSYLTHDGKRDIAADLLLHERLLTGSGFGHWSAFEHIARALHTPLQSGNFVGWEQYRKMHKGECQ